MVSDKENGIVMQEQNDSPGMNGEREKASLSDEIAINDTRRDEALDFLGKYKNQTSVELSKVASFTRAMRKKIDWRLMPFLGLCYGLNFIDKVLLNYAKIMGMPDQLHLTGDDYSNASSSFSIAVLLFSLPNVWLLNRLPAAKYPAINLIGWGICSTCHAALRNYAGLVTLRVLSGAFESGVLPTLMLLTSQYFTYAEQATRFGIFYTGMGVGQMLGGLISFAFQHMSPTAPLAGWKAMFLVLGLVTIVLGLFVLLCVPDTPMEAKFLSNDEKVTLLEHVKINQTGIQNKRFHPSQLLEGLLDLGCWGIFVVIILQTFGSGVISAYSATILTSFGYTAQQSALLNIPTGAVNIMATLSYAIFVRYYGNRWLVNVFAGTIGTIAAALLSFLPASARGGLLLGMYLINVLPGASSITFHWLTCNTAGHTKRTYATAGMNAAFAIGSIIGPLTFRAQDAPSFKPAKLTLVIMWAASTVASVFCFGYYWLANRSRDKKLRVVEEEVADAKAYAGLTDKQNSSFRYHY